MFQISDVKYVPTRPDVIVAAGDYDGRSPSRDFGATWSRIDPQSNQGRYWEQS